MLCVYILSSRMKKKNHEHKFGAKWCLKAEQSCFYFAVWILSLISLQGKREVYIVKKILSEFWSS